jgi:hypothetical protein
MNEVELLRELRAGLPAARPESRAAARAGLVVRIGHAQHSHLPRASAWRGRRLRLVVAGVALAALLIALPLALFGGSGRVQPAVAQVLHRAAEVAAAQEPVVPGPEQYLYTRSKSAYLTASAYLPAGERHPCTPRSPCDATGAPEWSVLVPSTRESWISLDGSRQGRVREVIGKPRFVSADQRVGWLAAGKPPLPRAGRVEDSRLSGGSSDGSGLPTDPAALRGLIEAREIPGVEGPPGEAETFVLIGDMLRSGYLPPAVRAALYEVTAELPGVELLGEVEDPVGRPGIGVAFTDRERGTRHELIFDPETSALLGEQVSLTGSKELYDLDAPPGTVIGYAAYLESRVVDSVGEGAPRGAGAPESSNGCYDRPSLDANVTVKQGADPIATCAKLWREGVVDTTLRRLEREGRIGERPDKNSPDLVACKGPDAFVALVFPGPGPELCARLGLVPFDPSWRE